MAVINGTDAGESLLGTPDSDNIRPLLGNDTIDGAAGYDFLEYFNIPFQVGIDLNLGTVTKFAGNQTFTDRVTNVEAATGGPASDGIIGNFLNNILIGAGGNDTIQGLDGDDSISGGPGNDSLDGGNGTDVAIYDGPRTNFTVAASGSGFTVTDITGAEGTDTLVNIESARFGGAGGTDASLASLAGSGGGTPTLGTPPLAAVTRGGVSTQEAETVYSGPVAGIQYQYLGTAQGEAVRTSDSNDFVNLLGGDDAANGGAGDDVLDGGTGSNFLTGGAGRDVFFLDGRGGQTTWSTITDWQAGEQLSVFGWQPGVSRATYVENAGTAGFTGVTMFGDLNGDGTIDTSVTWAGLTRAQLPASPIEQSGLLWFT